VQHANGTLASHAATIALPTPSAMGNGAERTKRDRVGFEAQRLISGNSHFVRSAGQQRTKLHRSTDRR